MILGRKRCDRKRIPLFAIVLPFVDLCTSTTPHILLKLCACQHFIGWCAGTTTAKLNSEVNLNPHYLVYMQKDDLSLKPVNVLLLLIFLQITSVKLHKTA